MKAVADWLQKITEWTMAATLAVMVVLVFGNAAGRYLFNSGLAASEEISRLAFVWLIFLGAVVAVRERAHVGVDMLVRLLPRAGRLACMVVTNALILYALWLFAEGSWQQTVIGLQSKSPVTGVPLAAFSAAGLVAAVAMGVLFALDLIRALTGRLSDDELVQVRESADEGEAAETLRELAPHEQAGGKKQ
ncbi:TRAP transporter small permease [Phyllobacterium leguminum]|uniref:TRAP transporter small permease protein n=1 Tax=Phyllobacterium leguminum TaxID=314237 RepID=A0A318T6M1_9HYPH|nr:TRAP transporter small permease [Phyllobacterium leguminum]PYE90051.1 TRAP-type C4-dicarboxylate transport system permease small subunit [Phyllobacterium leguminum]